MLEHPLGIMHSELMEAVASYWRTPWPWVLVKYSCNPNKNGQKMLHIQSIKAEKIVTLYPQNIAEVLPYI